MQEKRTTFDHEEKRYILKEVKLCMEIADSAFDNKLDWFILEAYNKLKRIIDAMEEDKQNIPFVVENIPFVVAGRRDKQSDIPSLEYVEKAAQTNGEKIKGRNQRIKETLAKRKKDGMKLGRPKGKRGSLKLDKHQDEIFMYLKKGINNKNVISKLIECSPRTLRRWFKRRKIKV